MHVLDVFLNHHRSKKKNFTYRFKLNSNIIQISIEILIQTTQTFNFRQHYSVKTVLYLFYYIYGTKGETDRKYGGEERSCIEILRF